MKPVPFDPSLPDVPKNVRSGHFPTREAAEAYKPRMFPTIPLVSLGGHSMTCPCGEAARLAAWGHHDRSCRAAVGLRHHARQLPDTGRNLVANTA
jgi:hypothetical protein